MDKKSNERKGEEQTWGSEGGATDGPGNAEGGSPRTLVRRWGFDIIHQGLSCAAGLLSSTRPRR